MEKFGILEKMKNGKMENFGMLGNRFFGKWKNGTFWNFGLFFLKNGKNESFGILEKSFLKNGKMENVGKKKSFKKINIAVK